MFTQKQSHPDTTQKTHSLCLFSFFCTVYLHKPFIFEVWLKKRHYVRWVSHLLLSCHLHVLHTLPRNFTRFLRSRSHLSCIRMWMNLHSSLLWFHAIFPLVGPTLASSTMESTAGEFMKSVCSFCFVLFTSESDATAACHSLILCKQYNFACFLFSTVHFLLFWDLLPFLVSKSYNNRDGKQRNTCYVILSIYFLLFYGDSDSKGWTPVSR